MTSTPFDGFDEYPLATFEEKPFHEETGCSWAHDTMPFGAKRNVRVDWRCPGCVYGAQRTLQFYGDIEVTWTYHSGDEPVVVRLSWLVDRAIHHGVRPSKKLAEQPPQPKPKPKPPPEPEPDEEVIGEFVEGHVVVNEDHEDPQYPDIIKPQEKKPTIWDRPEPKQPREPIAKVPFDPDAVRGRAGDGV